MFTTMIQAAVFAATLGTPAPVTSSMPMGCECPGCGPFCCCTDCTGDCCTADCPCPDCCCLCCCEGCPGCMLGVCVVK